MSINICFMSAIELAKQIKNRQLSPVTVIDAFLNRIEQRNPSLNAYITILNDSACKAAKKAEQILNAGEAIGPLHGVPIAIKDLYSHKKGVKTTFGAKPFANFIAQQDAICVQRLEQAGAIILGKTNTPEFGHKGTTDNYLVGPTSTPFNLNKNAGGSSGGSAAAVADGLAALAHGSDGGGSVRIPASFCGVYGLKPSFGRIPIAFRPDAFAATFPFLHDGILSRSVEDAALMLQVMAGSHPRDPFCLPDDGMDYLAAIHQPIKHLKIAYSPNLDVFPVDRQVQEVVELAVTKFANSGLSIKKVSLELAHSQQSLCDVWMRQTAILYAKMATIYKAQGFDLLGNHRNELPPQFIHYIERGQKISAVDCKLDNLIRTEVFDTFQNLFEDYDLLLCPTLAVPPVDNATDGNTLGPTQINNNTVDPLLGWCLTYPFNFTGHPSASIPAGLTADGLPVGLQIVGRRFADDVVLAASAAFERVNPWQQTYRRGT